MRDDAPATDAYAWSWPARLSGDDPYEWRGPIERQAAEQPAPTPLAPVVVEPVAEAPAQVIPAAPRSSDGTDDVWVELPHEEAKPARAKRPRRRGGKAVEALAEDAGGDGGVGGFEPAIVPVVAPEPLPLSVAEAVFEPEAVVATTPVTQEIVADSPAEPAVVLVDPAEIDAPPTKPKRGWWRRG